ncbi:MAG TPA: C2 family cysteine protease [Acetobacteraceae bacterium]|nr:C2 family cysteine protease [Acetobacteraceae bacterium]
MTKSHHPWDLSSDTDDSAIVPTPPIGGDDPATTRSFAPTLAATTAAPLPGKAQLYIQQPGGSTAISLNDLHQGQIGDCYLLSAIGEIALNNPTFISSIIKQNTNGTETVTLHVPVASSPGRTVLRTEQVVVTNNFPSYGVNGQGQDAVNGVHEIWPQVLESAYAQANGGYAAIGNGGSPVLAMEELTGQTAMWTQSVSAITAGLLESLSASKDLIVMDTRNSSQLPYNLVGNHAYMFDGIRTVNGAAMVQLANPWGFDQPSLIPVSQLSKGIVEVDVGRV